MRRIVTFSGGIGSWAAAMRVAKEYGTSRMTLLFSDTRMEDEDLYRFLIEGAAVVGAPLVTIADGRTPWETYKDSRFLGNSRLDPCSRILKREMADRWLKDNCDPRDTTVYVGIDWTEEHRFTKLKAIREAQGWRYEAPLCQEPLISGKADLFAELAACNIKPPRLYALGFSHNNCGGFCCKAGQGHFANLLEKLPERYAFHEAKEQEMREFLGKDVSMLTDRSGDGKKKPLTLKDFRIRVENGAKVDKHEVGGCGCFSDVGNEDLL